MAGQCGGLQALGLLLGIASAWGQSLQSAFELGYSLWNQGRYAEAARAFQQWTEAQPHDREAFLLLARCQLRRGDTVAALQALEGALRAGWSDTTLVGAEPEWSFLRQHPRGTRLLAELRRRAKGYGRVGTAFVPQERLGRYFVLYPPDYDTTRRYSLIVLLHGNSQEPAQLFAWARQWQPPDVLVIAPEAPYVRLRPTLNAAALRFSALGEELGAPDSLRREILQMTVEWYHSVVRDALRRFPVRRMLPIVVGFSQGGFLAAELLARHPDAYAGAALVAASYYPEGMLLERVSELRRFGASILLLHAVDYPIVPYQTAELLANALARAGVEFELFSFRGGHWASAEATERLRRWLQQLLRRY